MLMNKEEVIQFLPHRPPFLFVDTVQELILPESVKGKEEVTSRDLVGATAVANFEIREKLEILAGHFPGNPILPGVVQIEMMAQTSAFVSLGLKNNEQFKVETLLLNVESAKFRKPIVPGMKLEIRASMESCRGSFAGYKAEVLCEGQKISECKFMAKLDIIKE